MGERRWLAARRSVSGAERAASALFGPRDQDQPQQRDRTVNRTKKRHLRQTLNGEGLEVDGAVVGQFDFDAEEGPMDGELSGFADRGFFVVGRGNEVEVAVVDAGFGVVAAANRQEHSVAMEGGGIGVPARGGVADEQEAAV